MQINNVEFKITQQPRIVLLNHHHLKSQVLQVMKIFLKLNNFLTILKNNFTFNYFGSYISFYSDFLNSQRFKHLFKINQQGYMKSQSHQQTNIIHNEPSQINPSIQQ